jgi:C4-dicarboxylate transporter DctM subunit
VLGHAWWRARKFNYPRQPKASWGERWKLPQVGLGAAADRGGDGRYLQRHLHADRSRRHVAVYAFIVAVFIYKDMGLKDVPKVLLNSANMSAMLLYIITNAVLFSFIMTNENIPQALADWMLGNGLGVITFLLRSTSCCCWPATSWSRRPSC